LATPDSSLRKLYMHMHTQLPKTSCVHAYAPTTAQDLMCTCICTHNCPKPHVYMHMHPQLIKTSCVHAYAPTTAQGLMCTCICTHNCPRPHVYMHMHTQLPKTSCVHAYAHTTAQGLMCTCICTHNRPADSLPCIPWPDHPTPEQHNQIRTRIDRLCTFVRRVQEATAAVVTSAPLQDDNTNGDGGVGQGAELEGAAAEQTTSAM